MYIVLLILLSTVIGQDLSSKNKQIFESIKEPALVKGISEDFLLRAFEDESIQIHKEILERFAKPYERKSWEEYRKLFVKPSRINKGVDFYFQYEKILSEVSEQFGIDPFLLLSIVGIESNYGSHHKQYTVFNSLYTQISEMPKRARWAKKELIEFLFYCYQDSIPPQSISGSYAGAFGFGQFIPSSFNRFAVDYDGDGIRQAYEWPDVIASIANYLIQNGYPANRLSDQDQVYKSIYAYNHSDNYVKAVIELRNELEKSIRSKINQKD